MGKAEQDPEVGGGEQDPLLAEAVGLKTEVRSLKIWVIGLVVAVVTVAVAMVVMIFATFAVLSVSSDVKGIAANTNANSKDIKAYGQRLVDCTTPPERNAQGEIVVSHPCYEQLRAQPPNPNVAPIMENVDCLFRRALAGLGPPSNINNCPAG